VGGFRSFSCHTLPGYPGLEDLLALDRCQRVPPPRVTPALVEITSPLNWEAWQECLTAHTDRSYVEYLLSGLREGFHIDFDYRTHGCRRSGDNMRSARQNPQVVRDYISKECEAGRLLASFNPHMFPDVHISRFGVIPKADPGSWRLIVDLSSPEGASVNDGIDSSVCSLSYITVDDAARAIERAGMGARLINVDIKKVHIG